jgi:hypothetical protein
MPAGCDDIKYADSSAALLLGIAKRTAQGIELRVHPTLVPCSG